MIHRRKSPRTSYIKRSGREDFESNTFVISRANQRSSGGVRIFRSGGNQRNNVAWQILGQNPKSPSIWGNIGEKMKRLGFTPPPALYIGQLSGPDDPRLGRIIRTWPEGSGRWGPDDAGKGRIIRKCAEGLGMFDRMIRRRSGSSGFVQKILPNQDRFEEKFFIDDLENNVWTYKSLNSKWSGTNNNTKQWSFESRNDPTITTSKVLEKFTQITSFSLV